MGGGQVALSRVGEALDAARAAKKPVLAFATAYTDDSYQLAAHASEIWLNPIGGVMISGPGGSGLYYKGLIDRSEEHTSELQSLMRISYAVSCLTQQIHSTKPHTHT